MAKRPSLSKSESRVARTLWDLGEATARQVVAGLPEEHRRDFSTIQTYLSRLETKGYVTSRLEGRTKVFTPIVKPTQVIRETVDELVNRMFGGRSMSLMRHLIDEGHVSPDELTELRELIKQIDDQSPDTDGGPTP